MKPGGRDRRFYIRLAGGVACIAAGVALGQTIDQRLTLLAMFPAVALLSGVIAELTSPRKPETAPAPELSSADREIMAAVWNSGSLSAQQAAQKTSLSEADADATLSDLASRGYLKADESADGPLYSRAGR